MATVYKVIILSDLTKVASGLDLDTWISVIINYSRVCVQIPSFATYPIVPLVPNMHQRISALGF